MEIRYTKNREEVAQVIKIGDANSKTLGHFPRNAYYNEGRNNRIVIAIDNDIVLGYILFRIPITKRRASITHFCIDKAHRGKGLMKSLFDFLVLKTKHLDCISLNCREDYDAHHIWQKLNFVPKANKLGRGKDKMNLVRWFYSHLENKSLFDTSSNENLIAVIDSNIVYDLYRNIPTTETEKESHSLKADWLLDEISLYVTTEIYYELTRKTTLDDQNKMRDFIRKNFDEAKDNNYQPHYERLKELKLKTKEKLTDNTDSDIKHLAKAIAANADFYITRDKEVLGLHEELKESIIILQPAEMLLYIDELLNSSKYQQSKLITSGWKQKKISWEKFTPLISTFLNQSKGEKKNIFETELKKISLDAGRYNSLMISDSTNNQDIAMLVWEIQEGLLSISFLRIYKNKLSQVLAKYLLTMLHNIAVLKNCNIIKVDDNYISDETIEVLQGFRFKKDTDYWYKVCLSGVFEINDLKGHLETIKHKFSFSSNKIQDILALIEQNHSKDALLEVEKSLYNVKIIENDIPCYIIPIQPSFAKHLFDEDANEYELFGTNSLHLILNNENVYYKAANRGIISPSRVLWYISGTTDDKFTKNKKVLKATSYIDAVYEDSPKNLYKLFKNLGIYDFKDINDINKEKVLAFKFTHTEILSKTLTLKQLRKIYHDFTNKEFNPISAVKIPHELFMHLYKITNF
jgi:predicted nucleic acid-binding protein/GNAT superfamily N-acetyltransferase